LCKDLIIPTGSISNSQAATYNALGFEVALHVSTNCADWTPSSLEAFYADQLNTFHTYYPSLPSPVTNRTHCIALSDYVTQPQVEFSHGVRLDTNYYYWPPAWVRNRPGFFTGSGIPMRFAKTDGTLIDVYQAATQMTDESNQTYPYTFDQLLDGAVGSQEYYGAFTANMHTDSSFSSKSDAIISSALAREIPVVSARQMLQWLDGRNGSSFSNFAWSGNVLSFTVTAAQNTNGLTAMVPLPTGLTVSSVTQSGNSMAYSTNTIKGMQYVLFYVTSGSYQVRFGS